MPELSDDVLVRMDNVSKRFCRSSKCFLLYGQQDLGSEYDPAKGDPDLGIAAGTPFEAIPDDWQCPICGARKSSFVPYREAELIAA